MMRWRHGAGHHRLVAVVAECHDIFLLVFLPLEESLVGAVDVERRIVGQFDQSPDVITLERDCSKVVGQVVLSAGLSVSVVRRY